MTSAPLPSRDTLATLMTSVSLVILGEAGALRESPSGTVADDWHSLAILLTGASPLRISMAADDTSATALASAFMSVETAQVAPTMRLDALAELLNIVAGQIKSLLALDSDLGLPMPCAVGWQPAAQQHHEVLWLRSGNGAVCLRLIIATA